MREKGKAKQKKKEAQESHRSLKTAQVAPMKTGADITIVHVEPGR